MFLTEWEEQVPDMSFSVANLKDVRDQNTVFDSLVGFNGQSFILQAGAGAGSVSTQAERVNGRQVTSGMFETLGKQPIVGRTFGPEEEKDGAPGVALLGEGFWERRFGRDPGVVGRTLVLSGDCVHGDRRDAEDDARELAEHRGLHAAPAPRRAASAARTTAATTPAST